MAISKPYMVLLARGGSKGIYEKNIQTLGGVPLVRRTVCAALDANLFQQIIVSSDDKKITSAISDLPITIHKRSKQNSADKSTSEDAIKEVLDYYGIFEGSCFLTQCTTPFITSADMLNVWNLLQENQNCSIVSGYIESLHHWFLKDINHEISAISPYVLNRGPRQEGQQIFVENGGIYAFKISSFLRYRSRFMKRVFPYIMEKHRSIDIDTVHDLEIARHLLALGVESID
jgi:N-acylneuraminate cytidylyltransferase